MAVSSLRTDEQQLLSGTYSDGDIESMASEDGQAQLYTKSRGKGNREPRALHALREGEAVNRALVSHEFHTQLATIECEIEELAAKAPILEHAAISAVMAHESARRDVDRIRDLCRSTDLSLPEHRWQRAIAEGIIYLALAIGDLMFITVAYEVLGLSDRSVGYLPFSPLQLGATSTVIAMLVLTRLVGRFTRQLGHLFEVKHLVQFGPAEDEQRHRALVLRARFVAASAVLSTLGLVAILLGLSFIRASYLAQLHVPANAWEFLALQAGIAIAGCSTSFWAAHPLDREWHSATHHLRRAHQRFEAAQAALVEVVGQSNGLGQVLESVKFQHWHWTLASMHDARRKANLYARRVQLAQSEPTDETLLPVDLPLAGDDQSVDETRETFGLTSSSPKAFESVTMSKYLEHLRTLDVRDSPPNERGGSRVSSDEPARRDDDLSPKLRTNGSRALR